jgi:ComF family protein
VYVGVVKRLVYEFKFAPYVSDLGSLLVDLFYEGLIQQEGVIQNLDFRSQMSDRIVFVPVPLHRSKLRKRGYNQSLLLAKGMKLKFAEQRIEVWDCLERVRATHTQVGLSAAERKENLKGAFGVKRDFVEKLKNEQQVFLVDDIVTSGATLLEVAKTLKKNGVEKVWGITFAHGE